MGRPIYGCVLDGYWQDIGNLDQYRQANFDALDERVRLNVDGIRLRGNVWIGEGAEVDNVEELEGPAFIGNYCRIARDASVGPYTVLSNGVTLRERARTTRTVIDAATHVGRSTLIEGAIVGRSCDIRDHVRIHEGAAIGDEVTIGSESSVMPHVRVYPYKEVETGSQLYENLIWESRASSRLFGTDGVSGLVNVDLTPETAVRLAAALGTALKRGARVVASRDSGPACRMIKRVLISGLNATGVDVSDLRVSPPAVSRHVLKTQAFAAAVHVGQSHLDPEAVFIRIYEPPGILLTPSLQKEIEKNFTRQELRRVGAESVGSVAYPARVRESYAQDLVDGLDVEAIRARRFRIVVDYGYSAASFVLPLIVGPLGVEALSSHGFFAEGAQSRQTLAQAVGNTKRLVTAVGADLGAVFDRAAERLYLVDDQGHEVPVEQTLLLFLKLLAESGIHGKVAFPVTVTSQVDALVDGNLEVVRTPHSLADLTRAASADGVVFAGAVGGGYLFPQFLPAYDAVASLTKLLELLAPVGRPLSELVAELPQPTLLHRQLACPWAKKGLVMRLLNEQLAGRDLDLTDGIKLLGERGWAQVLPDPDEPLLHLYAEGDTAEASQELELELRERVEAIMQGDEAAQRTAVEASS
jgi:mannose-1-phosphate guanylyltransferase / phosphomannomutase